MNQPKFLPLSPIEEAQISLDNIARNIEHKTSEIGLNAKQEIDRVMERLEQELKQQAY
jgi:hypothetical protein